MKWYGKIGFSETKDDGDGIWTNHIIERYYYGDVITVTNSWTSRENASEDVNDDINLSVKISVIMDPYATNHLSNVKYIEYMGNLWKVTFIKPEFPRLILDLGGVWNHD